MHEHTYRTPEGFELYRPLLFPDAGKFEDVLTVDGSWSYERMNHRNGYAQPDTPANLRRSGWDKVISRFCSTRSIPGGRSMVVTPTQPLIDMVWPEDDSIGEPFAFFDVISFEAIYHQQNDRVLVVASASGIIASRWLAYVPLETVPTFAEVSA